MVKKNANATYLFVLNSISFGRQLSITAQVIFVIFGVVVREEERAIIEREVGGETSGPLCYETMALTQVNN